MIANVATQKLFAHPHNPRKDLGDLSELAESIKSQGVLQNLTVVPQEAGYCASCTLYNGALGRCSEGHDEDERPPCSHWESKGGYTVVIGHRRLAAAKLAGLEELPCAIVEMDERTQIATMLLENMQRNDLTVYEQARGFQMMLDLGETVQDISEKTGFSATTVRRRINLLELDAAKFKEADERGATIMDYAELEKIKDITRKNEVLDKIGTDNFKYALRTAIDTETAEVNEEKWRTALSAFATEVENTNGYSTVKYFSRGSEPADIRPDDADTTEYFFNISKWGTIYLLAERSTEPPEDPEAVRRREHTEARRKAQEEATKRAYELRKDFIASVNATRVKKHLAEIVTFAILRLFDEYDFADGSMAEFLGVEPDEDNGMTYDILLPAVQKAPERTLLAMVYCASGDRESEGYTARWNMQHKENEDLDSLYELLETLGYGMSDEEKALQDGSHELLKDDTESNSDSDDDAEEPCALCKAAHPACDDCCEKCEDPCNSAQTCRIAEEGEE